MAVAGGVDAVNTGAAWAGLISMRDKFHLSFVGAVSLMRTVDGAVAVPGAVWRCVQNVPPAPARNSSTLVWPAPTVRATARLQSLPAPHTQEPVRVVVREAVGAPVGPLDPPTAPSVDVSAPVKVATVMEAWYDPLCVAVTRAFVRRLLDTACQISAVPYWTLVRFRRRQVSPPPVTEVNCWDLEMAGPSAVTKAINNSLL
ncbi:hypothetical protein [Arthrobacter sp. KBS0702]|uniref:hypothetical protein n=1 Tax=Arthrobacter sp. KBS0702 TaxID=2578107 RepID=UPI0021BD278A|nr:hypothetical protein [Arthrobacter sp. KBS0702]